MERRLGESYEFGNFRFNPAERSLLHNGESIALTPRALDTLFALVSRSGHLVTKDELLQEVWQDAFVEEATLVQNISTLRKVLSRDGPEKRFIETVPKRGYRFVANVQLYQDERTFQPVNQGLTTGITSVVASNGNGAGVSAESDRPTLEISLAPAAAPNINQTEQTGRTFWHKRSAHVVVGLLALTTLGLLVARTVRQSRSANDNPISFEKMALARITQNGKARNSAISPDGNYVAYVAFEAGKQSLWIRQVSAPNDAQIISPAEVRYLGPTFSPDGNSVLVVTYEKGTNEGVLYRIPVIGGGPQRVITDIDSPVSFSPDGKQFAFVRGYPINHETALMIANADGTNEQKLASRMFPAFFSTLGPTWSPNGAVIACGIRDIDPHNGISETVVGVEVASRQEKLLTQQRWAAVGRLSWEKSGERIILTAAQEFLGPHQLWQISWPGGLAHRITNDLTDYRGVSLSSPNESALSTVATEANATIWLTSGPQYQATQLASTRNDGLGGIAWTPDNQLVFTSGVGTQAEIWIVDPESGLKRPLTSDNRRDFAPTVTRDGRFLIYSSQQEGSPARVWRTNIDGSNPKQLTNGNDDRFPVCSIDGKWVFYSSFIPNQEERYDEKVWRVPLDGGESTLVVDQPSTRPRVSPDGKLVSFEYQPAPDKPWQVRIISYETGEVVKDLPVAVSALSSLQWSPDGRGLTYVETADGVSNIWLLPLSGSAPQQITHFKTAQIFYYAWSPDGKRLAMVRGVQNGDVVLVRNFG